MLKYCQYCYHQQEISLTDEGQIVCENCGRFAPRWAWLLLRPGDEPTPAQPVLFSAEYTCADCGKPGKFSNYDQMSDGKRICFDCYLVRVRKFNHQKQDA